MFPHEHVFLAFVPVCLYVMLRYRQLPSLEVGTAVIVGSLLPDLIDKPLAHYFHVLPSGRVFLHSLPIAIPVALGILAYAWQTDRLLSGGAGAVAFLLHPFGDFYGMLLSGTIPPHLYWPFLSVQPATSTPSLAVPWTAFSFVALTGILAVAFRDIQLQFCRIGRNNASRESLESFSFDGSLMGQLWGME